MVDHHDQTRWASLIPNEHWTRAREWGRHRWHILAPSLHRICRNAKRRAKYAGSWLAAAVIVMALAVFQTWERYEVERVARIETQEALVRMQRADALRRLEDARWSTRYRRTEKGMEYEWRVKRIAGDS